MQLKRVVVKQMLFRPGIREGLVQCSFNVSDFGSAAAHNSHGPLLAIIAIRHLFMLLFKISKDKERVHYAIIFIMLLIA